MGLLLPGPAADDRHRQGVYVESPHLEDRGRPALSRVEADVVIVAGGTAGLAAAVAASESGSMKTQRFQRPT